MKFMNYKSNTFLYIYSNGNQLWYKNVRQHRLNGPAKIGCNGYRAWFQNGLLHCIYGPAVIYPDGFEYFLENGRMTK